MTTITFKTVDFDQRVPGTRPAKVLKEALEHVYKVIRTLERKEAKAPPHMPVHPEGAINLYARVNPDAFKLQLFKSIYSTFQTFLSTLISFGFLKQPLLQYSK